MYYIPNYLITVNGININDANLVDEDSNIILKFQHATDGGYKSKKPLLIDFEYTINEYNEIQVTDETANKLIAQYKDLSFKIFETPSSRQRRYNMAGMLAWANAMGDHGDTSGQFSNH